MLQNNSLFCSSSSVLVPGDSLLPLDMPQLSPSNNIENSTSMVMFMLENGLLSWFPFAKIVYFFAHCNLLQYVESVSSHYAEEKY